MSELENTGHKREGMNVAMLIDGDNAQPAILDAMVNEASKYGQLTFRRIYGDWTSQQMSGWKQLLQVHALQPIQQFRNTVGKNATDSALIIDAMDILHKEEVEIFYRLTSDSDFARLATRLREGGKMVIGIGKRITPEAFVKACNIFVYTENLVPFGSLPIDESGRPVAESESELPHDYNELKTLLQRAIELTQCEDGSCLLSQMGISLHKIDPGFDPRTYGRKKLLDLIQMYPEIFEVSQNPMGGPMSVWLKDADSCVDH